MYPLPSCSQQMKQQDFSSLAYLYDGLIFFLNETVLQPWSEPHFLYIAEFY